MHQEKYSLKWHTYSDHLKSMMKELMINEDFSDVTLVTEDKKHIKAHINILSACIPVFKDLLKKENNSNQIIYLRGIRFSEMKSIIQFIYLGEVTFYEERLDEFIAVAKLLEIKELSNAVPEMNVTPDDEPSPIDPETQRRKGTVKIKILELLKEQTNHTTKQDSQERDGRDQSAHQSETFPCDQFEYQATRPDSLTSHIKSKHDGVKYACGVCDYQATQQSHLTRHIQSKHEGVKYTCDQCDYQATAQDSLTAHIKSKHDGVRYACGQCDFQSSSQTYLTRHIKSIH